jgi:4-diphosphocytidyl-2-C-methyl-D-erythritol kinase
MRPAIEHARPKVNLTLRVLGRRADGYHALDSLVAFAHGIADTVTLAPGPHRSVATSGPYAATIAGANLVEVTLQRVAEAAPDLMLGHVVLEKHLPVASGIGGGSADAAAVLRAIRRSNGAAGDAVDWVAIATRLGADVPVCLASNAQRMQGIGERLTPLPALSPLDAVLVNPQVAVPADKTAQVFRALAAGPLSPEVGCDTPLADLSWREALLAHMRSVGNDLSDAACGVVPAIGEVLSALRATPACELAQLSGGGPTCFGIYPDAERAAAAANILARAYPAWWVVPCRLA